MTLHQKGGILKSTSPPGLCVVSATAYAHLRAFCHRSRLISVPVFYLLRIPGKPFIKNIPIPKLPSREYAQQPRKRFFPNLAEKPFTMPLKRVKIKLYRELTQKLQAGFLQPYRFWPCVYRRGIGLVVFFACQGTGVVRHSQNAEKGSGSLCLMSPVPKEKSQREEKTWQEK